MNTDMIAYTAGLFDGEGSISLVVQHTAAGKPFLFFRVQIGLTDEDTVAWLCKEWGGLTYTFTPQGDNSRPVHLFVLNGRKAGQFLLTIRPYLRVKAERADTALELGIHEMKHGVDWEKRQEVSDRMKVLNQRGATLASPGRKRK